MTQPGNYFSGAYVERRAEERSAGEWLAMARQDPDTQYLLMRGTETLMHTDASAVPTRIAFHSARDPRVATADAQHQVLLGWFEGRRCVLVELPPDAAGQAPGAAETFVELRPLAANLPPQYASLLAYARALTIWRSNHRFCGRCAGPCLATRAGHARRCSSCGHETFPRIDPARFVLVSNRERALLGRQPSWPPGRYSTIAGFVEPGESLEDAVRREVHEETGITASAVRYHSSQPWPFPASLMLGFHAEGDGEPHARDQELEDVRWFTRDQIRSGQVLLPPPEAISRQLIEHWLKATP